MPSEAALEPGRNPICVRLLYTDPVNVDEPALQKVLSSRLAGASLSPKDRSGVIGIRGPASVALAEGNISASLAITTGPLTEYDPVDYRQSWDWGYRDAAEAGGRARFAVTLSELGSMMLATNERLQCLLESVASLADAHSPLALHWVRHERFDEPSSFLSSLHGPNRMRSALNVRLFKSASGDGLIMDTLGLCLLGLLDLQMHFRGLDPGMVAEYLYDVGVSELLHGPKTGVRTGNPLEEGAILGPDGAPAKSRHEMAMMPPRRGVIDIEPSATFSARDA